MPKSFRDHGCKGIITTFNNWLHRIPVSRSVEAAGKVIRQLLASDAENSDLIECATINDLMLGKDH